MRKKLKKLTIKKMRIRKLSRDSLLNDGIHGAATGDDMCDTYPLENEGCYPVADQIF